MRRMRLVRTITRTPALLAGTLFLALSSAASQAAIRYAALTGTSAGAANGCPAWVLEGHDDDCSYDGGMPLGLGNAQWIGPVFTAGHYAPGSAPSIVSMPSPDPGPVTAPAAVLAPGGKTGIPVTRGFISIDDRDSPAAIDDVIGGTFEFGAFERNIGVGATTRQVESIGRVIHRLAPVRVSAATPNAAGGYDYVVARAGTSVDFPTLLTGATTAGGGFADDFPSEIGSQSSADAADVPYWTMPGSHGIARLDGDSAVFGTRSAATVWNYSCDDGDGAPGPLGCTTGGLNWDGDGRASFANVLLRISTNAAGDVTAASAFVVNEADLSAAAPGADSWSATTLGLAGEATSTPTAFDDRSVLVITAAPEDNETVTVDVLANDLAGTAPVVVDIVTAPAAGTATVTSAPAEPNRIQFVRNGAPEGEQVIVYRITDDEDRTAIAELHMLVTDPITCDDDEATGARNATTTVDVLANDTGFDLPPVTVTLIGTLAAGTAVVNADRTISFTPPADTGGLFSVSYRLADGSNRADFCALQVRVPALPQAIDDTNGVVRDTATVIDVLANDSEITDTPLVLAIATGPEHGEAVPDTSGARPQIRYTPAAGYTGTDAFTYTVTDADGESSAAATVALTVFGPPQTDLPSCTADAATTDPGMPVTVDVLANDTGLNALPVVVEITDYAPANAGTAVVEADNRVTFTPAAGQAGTLLVRYRTREAVNSAVQCTLSVTIDGTPAAADDSVDALNFGEEAILDLLGNDTGLVDAPLVLTLTGLPAHGTARVCAAESDDCVAFNPGTRPYVVYRYDDSAGYPATDTFRYRVTDADGDASDEATVTITPRNVPTANDDPDGSIIASEDFRTASGSVVRVDVLANDGGFLRPPLTVTIEAGSAGGSASVNADQTVTFRASEGFIGLGRFTYRITDADGATDTAMVTIVVFPAQTTDSGGSAVDPATLLVLGAVFAWRRRRAT